MTTLTQLARKLGITEHGAFVLAGLLIQRAAYWEVITDAETGELTAEAEQAITRYVAARVNTVTLDEPLTPEYARPPASRATRPAGSPDAHGQAVGAEDRMPARGPDETRFTTISSDQTIGACKIRHS